MCKSINCNHSKLKIPNYSSFLLESNVVSLITEGNLVASQKFLSKLSSIKSDPIANALYNAFSSNYNIEKDLSQNWVDVTDKDDVITFMADRGAIRLENDAEAVFSAKGRNEIKVGRFARIILTEIGQKVTDREIEVFVNTYKSVNVDNSKRFEMVTGPLIKKYYLGDNYANTKGTLDDSCMRYDACQGYFKIYTKNPNQCQLMVYLNDDGKVLGRALVWKMEKNELYNKDKSLYNCNSEYFMDRVYTSSDSDVIKFTNHAKANNWLYKYKMTADTEDGMVFNHGGSKIYGKILVKLDKISFRKYPFFDTLSFCNDYNLISNVGFFPNDEEDETCFIMTDTGGDSECCSECKGTGYDENDDDSCKACEGDGEINCPICVGVGLKRCKKCEGDGNIKCQKCDGDGTAECRTCNGSGDIDCSTCAGKGSKKCLICKGKGNLGNCNTCTGQGTKKCITCNGEPLTCYLCEGVGKVDRKGRMVRCTACDGEGKSTRGDSEHTGCKCGECGSWVPGGWKNTGKNECEDCDGNGERPCTNDDCDGGDVSCEECDGDGTKSCEECSHGSISCEDCDGLGNTGDCEDCDGVGTLGDCLSCGKTGQIKCIKCDGSGEKIKGYEKDLCPECTGLLTKLIGDIELGEYKF